MSPRGSDRGPVGANAPDVYVGLLFLSLAALITGILFLVLELSRYDWKMVAG